MFKQHCVKFDKVSPIMRLQYLNHTGCTGEHINVVHLAILYEIGNKFAFMAIQAPLCGYLISFIADY